jgi:hypothetical protein
LDLGCLTAKWHPQYIEHTLYFYRISGAFRFASYQQTHHGPFDPFGHRSLKLIGYGPLVSWRKHLGKVR